MMTAYSVHLVLYVLNTYLYCILFLLMHYYNLNTEDREIAYEL